MFAISSIRTHVNFTIPPLMKVFTDFHLINEISRAFYAFVFRYKHSKQWPPKCIVEIVLINNLGFKVSVGNFGTKYDFKYAKRH